MQGKHKKVLRIVSRRTRCFRGSLKSTSTTFQRISKARSLKNCPRILTKGSHVFFGALYKFDVFFLNRKYGHAAKPFEEHPAAMTSKTGTHFSAPQASTSAVSDQEKTSDMVRAVQEEIPCCSFGNSSGKQKKARSTSQPQICSENTPAKNEADQILLAPSSWRATAAPPTSTPTIT